VTQINHKYTLVLGGGGARGIAHLGILRVLERERLLPSLIVGTSIGAVIGSMFSQTLNSHECERRIESLFKSDFFKRSDLSSSVLKTGQIGTTSLTTGLQKPNAIIIFPEL
jgi:predicted acylesterase/phospholipase RssA